MGKAKEMKKEEEEKEEVEGSVSRNEERDKGTPACRGAPDHV